MPIYTWLEPVKWLAAWLTDALAHSFRQGSCFVLVQRKACVLQWHNQRENNGKTNYAQKNARKVALTVFQYCEGYSLAWIWEPVHGSLLWCHCRYTRLGRHRLRLQPGQRASPPTSTVWPVCPLLAQSSYLEWACSPQQPFLHCFCFPKVLQHLTSLLESIKTEKWFLLKNEATTNLFLLLLLILQFL